MAVLKATRRMAQSSRTPARTRFTRFFISSHLCGCSQRGFILNANQYFRIVQIFMVNCYSCFCDHFLLWVRAFLCSCAVCIVELVTTRGIYVSHGENVSSTIAAINACAKDVRLYTKQLRSLLPRRARTKKWISKSSGRAECGEADPRLRSPDPEGHRRISNAFVVGVEKWALI